MYSRNTPLWANTYHAFQTSAHGKYRFLADVIVDENVPITSILRDFQLDGHVGMYLEEWLNSLSLEELEKAILAIKEYAKTVEDAKNTKVIVRKAKSGKSVGVPKRKDLVGLIPYLEGRLNIARKAEFKRLESEKKRLAKAEEKEKKRIESETATEKKRLAKEAKRLEMEKKRVEIESAREKKRLAKEAKRIKEEKALEPLRNELLSPVSYTHLTLPTTPYV